MARLGPSAITLSSLSVTTVAISMMTSISGLRPVISRSIHTRWLSLGMQAASAKQLPAGQRVRQRATIHIFKLTAHRHAVRDAAGAYTAAGCQLAQEVRGSLAFHSWVGGQNQ